MTTTETAQGASAPRTARHGNPWRPSLSGVALVTHIELLRRRPSTKGYFAYGTMLAIIIGLGILVSVMSPDGKDSTPLELVLILVLGSLVLFAFSGALVSDKVVQKNRYIDWEQLSAEQQDTLNGAYMSGDFSDVDVDSLVCAEQTYEHGFAHTEKTASLLLVNPGVMSGEFSPIVNPSTFAEDGRAAPGIFAQIHQGVSSARIGPSAQELESRSFDDCANIAAMAVGNEPDYGDNGQDWEALQLKRATYNRAPWLGLGVQAALLLGSMTIVVRRLRVPYTKLRAGTRVA